MNTTMAYWNTLIYMITAHERFLQKWYKRKRRYKDD